MACALYIQLVTIIYDIYNAYNTVKSFYILLPVVWDMEYSDKIGSVVSE